MNTVPKDFTPGDPTGRSKIKHNQVELGFAANTFNDWQGLLDLMHKAFAQNVGKVDPPSTVYESTARSLKNRAERERLLLAYIGHKLVGCLFMRREEDELFLSRFAILPGLQGSGLARRMITEAERVALQLGLASLTLEVRVELFANQQKFTSLGFDIVGGRSHSGFSRITTLKMTKQTDVASEPGE